MTTPGALPHAVAAQASRLFAARDCLAIDDDRWTYARFQSDVDRLAAGLARRFEPGVRIGLFMANRAEYMLAQFALERAGLIRVPLNMRYTSHEVGSILDDCGAAAVLYDSATLDRVEQLMPKRPLTVWLKVDNAAVWSSLQEPPTEPRAFDVDAICSINYTSGTSGRPKGVVLTHRNWSALTRNMLIDRDLRGNDVVAHIGPLTHASGTYFLPWFLRGARQVIVREGTVDALLAAIARERVTAFTCVPTVLTRIVNHPHIDEFDLSSLRMIGYGAEPIPVNTLQRAIDRFGMILVQNYGLTEAMMTVTTLRADDHFTTDAQGRMTPRIGCIGRPYTFVEVVLRDVEGAPVALGEIGEITIRSEHMMNEYWNRPGETAKVLRDGWLWSGDLARLDDEGRVYLVGRSKDMLISGGFNIYPAEVEAVLTDHPRVVEAAVVGIPDPDWGETPIAYVALTGGRADVEAELISHCKEILGLRAPRKIHVMPTLPKTPNGKTDKSALRQHALHRSAPQDGR